MWSVRRQKGKVLQAGAWSVPLASRGAPLVARTPCAVRRFAQVRETLGLTATATHALRPMATGPRYPPKVTSPGPKPVRYALHAVEKRRS